MTFGSHSVYTMCCICPPTIFRASWKIFSPSQCGFILPSSFASLLCCLNHTVCIGIIPTCSFTRRSPARKHSGLSVAPSGVIQGVTISLSSMIGRLNLPLGSRWPTLSRPLSGCNSLSSSSCSFSEPYTLDASMYEVSSLSCCLSVNFPVQQVGGDRLKGRHLRHLMRGSSFGTAIGKHGSSFSHVISQGSPSVRRVLVGFSAVSPRS